MVFATTLTADVGAADLTISVADNTDARTTYPWRAKINDEIFLITGGVEEGLVWTVTRGAEDTDPVAHLSGAAVESYAPGGVAVDTGSGPATPATLIFGIGTAIDPETNNVGAGVIIIQGPVLINPDATQEDSSLHVSQPVGAGLYRVLVDSVDGDGTFSVGGQGTVYIDAAAIGTPALEVDVDGASAFQVTGDGKVVISALEGNDATPALGVAAATEIPTLFRLRTVANDILTVTKTGAFTHVLRGGYFSVADSVLGNLFVVGADATSFVLATGASLEVLASDFSTIFSVHEDGSVHIKTGTAILADL